MQLTVTYDEGSHPIFLDNGKKQDRFLLSYGVIYNETVFHFTVKVSLRLDDC